MYFENCINSCRLDLLWYSVWSLSARKQEFVHLISIILNDIESAAKGRVKNVGLFTFGWVGLSRWGQNPQKNLKSMPSKCVLG